MNKKTKLKLGMAFLMANVALFANSPMVSADTTVTGTDGIKVEATGTAPDQTFAVSLEKKFSGIESINAGGAMVMGKNSLAMNGSNIMIMGDNSIAMGDRTNVMGSNAFALGSGSEANGSNSVALGGGVASQKDSLALGLNARTYKAGSVAIGAGSHTKDVNANAGKYTIAEGMDELTFASNDKNRSVSFGEAGDIGETRTLQNVSAGELSETSTDAVNGSQLHLVAQALNKKIDEAGTSVDEKVKAVESKAEVDASNIDVRKWQDKLGVNNVDFSKVDEDMSVLGAQSAALSSLKALGYDPMEKIQVMAGVGMYKSQSALALGLAVHANEDFMLNGGIAVNKGSTMVNAGVSMRFGAGSAREGVSPLLKNGPITAVYRMAEEMESVKAENKELRETVDVLRAEMMQMKKEMAALRAGR